MAQFLKGQKVFALTDGRLFWRKEGKPDQALSQATVSDWLARACYQYLMAP